MQLVTGRDRRIDRRSAYLQHDDLDIEIQPPHLRQKKPENAVLQFGHHFADHMFESYWRRESGWSQPKICPVHALQMHPAAKVHDCVG